MCLLVFSYAAVQGAPVLVAANREERFDRAALPPHLQPGRPRVLCGIDCEAGGTWLGVNEFGLLVAVTNRPRAETPPRPRSRGTLCRELLNCPTAEAAAGLALESLGSGRYRGANYVCLDRDRAFTVHGGDRLERLPIEPGLHLMANGDLDDLDDERLALACRCLEPEAPGSVAEFIDRTADVCAREGIIVRHADRGTVSSDQVALTVSSAHAVYRHAPGPPDRLAYDDRSELLRELLSGAEGR
jgi:hypothetical protein